MYRIIYTHFEPDETLYDYNTIVLEMKAKRFKTFDEALNYLKAAEKRNITKNFRNMFGEFYADFKYLYNGDRVTIDVYNVLSDKLVERFEYRIVKA